MDEERRKEFINGRRMKRSYKRKLQSRVEKEPIRKKDCGEGLDRQYATIISRTRSNKCWKNKLGKKSWKHKTIGNQQALEERTKRGLC